MRKMFNNIDPRLQIILLYLQLGVQSGMPPERVDPDRTDWQLGHVLKVRSRDGRNGVGPQRGHAHGPARNPVSCPSDPGRGLADQVPSSAEVVAADVVVVVVVGRKVGNASSHAAVVRVIWNDEKSNFKLKFFCTVF